jgi:hypothetical protein
MPSPKVFVNNFVVLLNDYYINLRATTKSVFMALVGGLRGGGGLRSQRRQDRMRASGDERWATMGLERPHAAELVHYVDFDAHAHVFAALGRAVLHEVALLALALLADACIGALYIDSAGL